MFNKIFSIIMSVVFPLQVMANSVSTSVQLNFDEQSSYVNQMRDFLNIYSEKYYVDKALAELKMIYTNKVDRLYMQKIIAIGEKPSQLVVATTPRTIEITATGISKIILSDFDPKTSSLKINGKEFKVSKNVPLEETNNRLADLLSPSEKTSLMELFIPKAHAKNGSRSFVLFISLFVIMPIASASSKAQETTDRISAIIKACEDRDDRVHFDNSKTRLLLRKYESDLYNFDFPEINSNTECSAWAKEILKIRKVSTGVATNWCMEIKRANKCIEDYKLGRPKKVQEGPKPPTILPKNKVT